MCSIHTGNLGWTCVVDRVGIQLPTIEVRYENLTIDADCFVGGRALPTLKNAMLNFLEVCTRFPDSVLVYLRTGRSFKSFDA